MTFRPTSASGGAVTNLANGSRVEHPAAPFAWDDWFQHAAPHQRALALSLAQQQGFVYSHQLPAVSNGKAPVQSSDSVAARAIARLLAGKTELPALACPGVTIFDEALDEVQRLAVERAIATPDLFLLQGLPGTGKSRVVAEILRQSAARGQRVLFLADHTASLDVVLARLVDKPEIFALRLLEANEKPESLSAMVRSFTAEEQKKTFLERVSAGARGNCDRVEAACRRHADQQPLWTELAAHAERHRQLRAQRQSLTAESEIAAAVERDVAAGRADSPRLAELAELSRAHLQADADLTASRAARQQALDACRGETSQLATRIGQLEPAYLAKKHSRFWTPAFWSNLFNGSLVQEMESLQQQRAAAEERQRVLSQELEQLDKQTEQERDRHRQACAALTAAEVSARQELQRTELLALDAELSQIEARWNAHCEALGSGAIEKSAQAIADAEQAWLRRKALSEEECQFAHQWATFVSEAAPQWTARLGTFANIVATTVQRWQADGRARECAAGPFDLIVIEDADTLSESDLLKLAGQAPRCVLVATSLFEAPPAGIDKGSRVIGRPQAAPCWPRLWQALDHQDWPHTWRREDGRLVCQLVPLTGEDAKHLESECLADAPDIELRILHRPLTRPCLAQVRFSPGSRFADAFAFMVREVQEFPLQPVGRTGWWHEDERRICRHLGPGQRQTQDWLEIEPGVRLATNEESARISAVEFDKTAGWDRARADAWLERHRACGDCERTAFLQVPYRFQPMLASHVTTLVRDGIWVGAVNATHDRRLEFHPVPSSPRRDWPTDPAGLELDLSLPRCADKLPAGVRHGLPTRGFVNYAEAQILIRRLEAWSQQEATDCSQAAVLALYEGQAILLRRLIEQSEILRARRHPLEVALPSRLHQHEFDVVFLSLTRSQQRGVCSFGDDLRELPIALTRARARLFVFGDPGALSSRATSGTPANRQAAHDALQEQVHLARLVECVRPKPTLNGSHG
ncbi:MAG TPA: AAA domain-containing protein [Gemmataceae bacterium]|nr:AAA domain-containing protein [Gemmataceae bacterium]